MRRLVPTGLVAAAVSVMAAVLVACGTAGRPPHHATWDEAAAAALVRAKVDGSARLEATTTLEVNGTSLLESTATSEFRLGPDGPTTHGTGRSVTLGAPETESELIVFPDAAYLLLLPVQRTDGRPYFQLLPDATDWLSLNNSPNVALQRATGTRIYCGSELGRTEIAEAVDDELDGRPVVRYRLRIDLRTGSESPYDTEYYRRLGLSEMIWIMVMDSDDRILRCSTDTALPGGSGRMVIDQRFFGFGEPVDIRRPAPELVTTTPPPGP